MKLDEFINQLKQKSENYNTIHNVGGVQKTRKNVRENFTFSMLLGIEEAREKGDLEKITNFKANSDQD